MSDGAITTFWLDPNNPPKTDWSAVAKLTDDEIHAAALSDPDAQPATAEQLAHARRTLSARLIRKKFGLTQEQFARRFGLRLELVQGWENKSIIPETVRRVVAAA